MQISVEKPATEKLEQMGVAAWPIWEKEASTFSWHYGEKETCYILEGKVVVEPKGGEAVEINAGDLVVFPVGMDCVWNISRKIKKHYKFG